LVAATMEEQSMFDAATLSDVDFVPTQVRLMPTMIYGRSCDSRQLPIILGANRGAVVTQHEIVIVHLTVPAPKHQD
jgi:hypothetical protein